MGESAEKKPFGQRVREKANEVLTAVLAGVSLRQLRAMFRGEELDRPDPRITAHRTSFWLHMKPRRYARSVIRFTYTFGLGFFSVFLAVVLGVTGFLLMVFYTPSTDVAYFDMLNIMGSVPFGKLMRDVHRLAAEAMVVTVMLHMVRVFVTGSYKQPRSFNWLVGVALLLVTLLFSYSGYLLPWDQIAYWAVTIGTSVADSIPVIGPFIQKLMLGGQTVGQLGLLRFYTLHVIILPIALAILFGVHYYKVVRQGLSLPPAMEAQGMRRRDDEQIPYLPDILIREVLWVMLGLLVLMFISVTFFSAPLEDHANPFKTPLHATAPWYFLWIQGLIKLPDVFGGIIEGRFVYGVVIPGAFFGLLFALPYVDRKPNCRWRDRKLTLGLGALAIVALAVLTWMGTPAYGLDTPAAQELALEFVPTDREGAIHELRWDDLADGVYQVSAGTVETSDPSIPMRLADLLGELADAMAREADDLPGGAATLTIRIWQRGLKRVDLNISWGEGGGRTFDQHVYVHKDTLPQE